MAESITVKLDRLRAELNALPNRGWDDEREVRKKRAEIDAALEELLAARG